MIVAVVVGLIATSCELLGGKKVKPEVVEDPTTVVDDSTQVIKDTTANAGITDTTEIAE